MFSLFVEPIWQWLWILIHSKPKIPLLVTAVSLTVFIQARCAHSYFLTITYFWCFFIFFYFFALASKVYTANHFLRKCLLHWQHSFHANLAFFNVAEFMRLTWGDAPWNTIVPGRKLESWGKRQRKQTWHVCRPNAYTFNSLSRAEWGNIVFLEGVPFLNNFTAGWRTSMASLKPGLDNGLVAKPAHQPRISWLMAQKS